MNTLALFAVSVAALGLLVWVAVRLGRRKERNVQDAARLEAADIAAEELAEARKLDDDQLDKELDRWTRK